MDERWLNSVERRLDHIEEDLRGKEGVSKQLASIQARLKVLSVGAAFLLTTILGAVVADLIR
jgi:hypothetical protein